MMPFRHLVDETRVSALLTGGGVALFIFVLKVEVGLWVYALCFFLSLLGLCGGAYFDRDKETSRPFLIWSVFTLSCSAALMALVSYYSLAVFGGYLSILINALTWGVIVGGFVWLVFVRRLDRESTHINTNFVAGAGVIGSFVGGVAFLISKEVFMSIVGFLAITPVVAVVVGLLLNHLRDLLEN